MSKLNGRPVLRFPHSGKESRIDFNVDQFRILSSRIGGNPCQWSLKREWRMFAKNYFDSNYVREKHVRAAYDYFHKHKSVITNSPIYIDEEEDESCELERNVEPEPETKQNIISLPRLETVSNPNFFIKCQNVSLSDGLKKTTLTSTESPVINAINNNKPNILHGCTRKFL